MATRRMHPLFLVSMRLLLEKKWAQSELQILQRIGHGGKDRTIQPLNCDICYFTHTAGHEWCLCRKMVPKSYYSWIRRIKLQIERDIQYRERGLMYNICPPSPVNTCSSFTSSCRGNDGCDWCLLLLLSLFPFLFTHKHHCRSQCNIGNKSLPPCFSLSRSLSFSCWTSTEEINLSFELNYSYI